MRSPVALLLVSALALAACVETGAKTGADAPDGEALVDAGLATTLFKQICADTAPDIAAARAKIAGLPFQQDAASGTYFHRQYDLSVTLSESERRCVMTFAGESGIDPKLMAAVVPAAKDATVLTTAPTVVDGRSYYSAAVAPK